MIKWVSFICVPLLLIGCKATELSAFPKVIQGSWYHEKYAKDCELSDADVRSSISGTQIDAISYWSKNWREMGTNYGATNAEQAATHIERKSYTFSDYDRVFWDGDYLKAQQGDSASVVLMKHGEQVGFSNRSSNSVTHLHSRTRGSCDEPSTEDLKKQAAPHFACDGFYIGDFCQSRATGLPEKSAVVDTPTVTSPNATQNPEEDSKVKPVGSVNPSMLKGEGYEAIKIVKGTFDIGCTPEEKRIQDCYKYEMPSHKVTITNDFYMMKSEVTQGLYEKVMGSNPSYFNSCGSDCPVENVTWYGAIKFANALSKKEGLEQCYSISGEGTASVNVSWSKGVTCTGWRLPTEAEWEYAARGGEKHSYSGSNNPDEVAWSGQNNSDDTTHLVCGKKTNGYGLCDMSGNVWEWCWDWFELYDSTSKTDPIGPDEAMWLPSGPQRLKRGGSYGFPVWHTRVSNRYGAEPSIYYPHLGFRLIISTS